MNHLPPFITDPEFLSVAAIGGGFQNTANGNTSFIGGGAGNSTTVGAALSVIGGGEGNTVTIQGNAILGGIGNNDGGLNGVMIVGNNINPGTLTLRQDALHINGLLANNIPDGTTGPFQPGTVFWLPFGTTPTYPLSANGGVLWIM